MRIERPNMEIRQELTTQTVRLPTPTRPAVLMGPVYEIVDLQRDGVIDEDIKVSYRNILASRRDTPDFPGLARMPSGELSVAKGFVAPLEDEVRGYVRYGGSIRELSEYDTSTQTHVWRNYLTASHVASRAALVGATDLAAGGLSLSGTILSLCVDKAANAAPHYLPSASDGKDTVITFGSGSETGGTLSVEDVAAQINAVLPDTAYVVEDGAAKYLALVSSIYGAKSRVILRDKGASQLLGFHSLGQGDLYALGSGYRAKDDGDRDLISPYLEVYVGAIRKVGSSILAGAVIGSDLTSLDSYDGSALPRAAVSFQSLSSHALLAGDAIWADGVSLGMLRQVQSSTLSLGSGATASAVSDLSVKEVGLLTHPTSAFAPRYVTYIARHLAIAPPSSSTSATLTSPAASIWNDPEAAQLYTQTAVSFPLAFGAGATLKYTVMKDGAWMPERTHVISGTAASLADLIAALNTNSVLGIDVTPSLSSVGEIFASVHSVTRIAFQTGVVGTPKTGSTQRIQVGNGTANILLDPTDPALDANEVYQGLDTYSETRHRGNGNANALDHAVLSTVDAVTPIAAAKTFQIESVRDNEVRRVLLLSAVGDFSGGSTPYADTNRRVLYNMAKALNGEYQSSTSGLITIVDVDGDTDLAGQRLSDHPELVEWLFLGPDQHLVLTATGGVGAFTVGEQVTQAVSLATGILVSQTGGPGGTITIQPTSGTFNLSDTITGDDSGATATGAHTVVLRLALLCGQEGQSNLVVLKDGDGSNLLSQSIGFANNTACRGQGVRPGATLDVYLDESPTPVSASAVLAFVQNGDKGDRELVFLDQIASDLNAAAGEEIATVEEVSGSQRLVLLSTEIGLPSRLVIDPNHAGYVETVYGSQIANAEMGLTYHEATATSDPDDGRGAFVRGVGRPRPGFYVSNDNGEVFVWINKHQIRNQTTGVPFGDVVGDWFIVYRGLRTDVSPANPDLTDTIAFDSLTTLEASLGLISTRNPLALMGALALQTATAVTVHALGVDAVTEEEPDGTLAAWDRALDWLASKRGYAIAPATSQKRIHDLVAQFAIAQSEDGKKNVRKLYATPAIPDETAPDLLGSGAQSNASEGDTSLTVETSILSALVEAGVADLSSIDADEGIYLEVEGNQKRYSVEAVSGLNAGSVITIRTSFVGDDNDDAFYATEALPFLADDKWAIYKRGHAFASLTEKAETIAAQGAHYASRRVMLLVADEVEVNLNGTRERIPGFYASAVYAAMASQYGGAQGFTNLQAKGLLRVYGTHDTFAEDDLDLIAGGGMAILIQDSPTSPVICRHQLTTDTSSIETQEDSITRAIDYAEILFRSILRPYIGPNNITDALLNTLSAVATGACEELEKETFASCGLVSILPIEDDPTGVDLLVDVDVLYPLNRLRLRIRI